MRLIDLRNQVVSGYTSYMKSCPIMGSASYYDAGKSDNSLTEYTCDIKGLEHLIERKNSFSATEMVFLLVPEFGTGKRRVLGRMATVLSEVRRDYSKNGEEAYVFIASQVNEDWKKEMASFKFVDAQQYLDRIAKVSRTSTKKEPGEKVGKMDQSWFKLSIDGYKTSLNKILASYPGKKILYQVASNKDCMRFDGKTLVSSHNYTDDLKKLSDFFDFEMPVIIYLNPTVFKIFNNMAGYESTYDFYQKIMAEKKEALEEAFKKPVLKTEYEKQAAENLIAFIGGKLDKSNTFMRVLEAALDGGEELTRKKRKIRDIASSFYTYDEMNRWIDEAEHNIDEDLFNEYPLLRYSDKPYSRYQNYSVRPEVLDAVIGYIKMVDEKKAA